MIKLKFIVLITLLILSVYLIFSSVTPNINLPHQENRFWISGLEENLVKDLSFSYDFEKDKGYFKFKVFKNIKSENISRLDVFTPTNLNITDYSITEVHTNRKIESSNKKLRLDNDHLTINQFGNQDIKVLINFTSLNNSFYPNGVFIFIFEGAN